MRKPPDPRSYIHLGPRATSATVKEFTRISNNQSPLTWGIDAMDDRVRPFMAGETITFLGRPGMGKTSFLVYMAKRYASILNNASKKKGDAIDIFLYATWETMVEEFMGVFSASESGYTLDQVGRGNVDMSRIKKALVSMMGTSVAVFGRSMELARSGLPMPGLFDLAEAVRILNEDGYNVVGTFIDYLQLIPGVTYDNKREDRSARTSENMNYIKELGVTLGCWNVVAAQAKREVDDYGGLKFPTNRDGQWASTIEQDTDKLFGITVPGKYLPNGFEIELNGFLYQVTDTMFGIKMNKQRFGPALVSDVWLLDFDMGNVDIKPHATVGEVEQEDVF